jgi:iron-sulfur cluster assembly protein
MAEAPLVELTERAAQQIRDYLKDEAPLPPLRLALVRTHCMGGRGHAYDVGLAEGRTEEDLVAESQGITFLIDPKSAPLIQGIRVDYVAGLQSSGFALDNPNATGKCHCGRHDLFG